VDLTCSDKELNIKRATKYRSLLRKMNYKDKKYPLNTHLLDRDAKALHEVERGTGRGGGLGSRPKKMYGERLGDGVEYHLMKPTPRR